MTPTIAEQITAFLATATSLLNLLVSVLADFATFLGSNALTIVAISFTIAFVVFGIVRSRIRA